MQGHHRALDAAQTLAIVGSAPCCHLKLASLPAVACVLYHCGSTILFCDLTRSGSSAFGLKIRSSTKLQVQGHQLDLEFSPTGPDINAHTWPQIEFFHRDWSQRRQLSSQIAAIGSDYPSHYRLRGSSLAACHALLFWHDAALHLVDLSETDRERGPERAQEIRLGRVRFCRDVGIRFCDVVNVDQAGTKHATHRRMELTQRRCQKMELLNAQIVRKFELRSMKSTHFRRMVHFSLLMPVIVLASMYGYQLLRLLTTRI